MSNEKLWGGRFESETSPITERIGASVHYDSRMYAQDIRGSIAHARMLKKIGILSSEDLTAIESGLEQIKQEIENGTFNFSTKLEDVHMNIESRLTDLIGDAGKRLHTGRSRNDQVATDTRLYIRDEGNAIREKLEALILLLADIAEKNIEVIMPGYTHLQIAQPVRFSHHMLAHAWALNRDLNRLNFFLDEANVLALGSGALAGVNYPNDRDFLKKELQFDRVTANSMDTVSDRDYLADILYFCSMIGMHLSRFSEELVLWTTAEFNFIRLADSVTTGSSIMPQKRNSDVAELTRGKSGRLYGNLISLLTVLKGLPLTYNRDLQEDKEVVFDSLDTVNLIVDGMIEMLSTMTINSERMKSGVYKNYSTATDLADYLVIKGVPFRESHHIVGSIVKYCEQNKTDFFKLDISILKGFSEIIDNDVYEILDPETSTERKKSAGSTSRDSVKKQIVDLRNNLKK